MRFHPIHRAIERPLGALRRLPFAALLFGALHLALGVAAGAADDFCWAATREQPQTNTPTGGMIPVTSPEVAPIRDATRTVEALFRAHPSLPKLPEARVRISRFVSGGVPRAAHVHAIAYGPPTWVGDRAACGLTTTADLTGPATGVSVAFNTTDSMLSWQFQDDELRATSQPRQIGTVHGHPKFHVGPMDFVVMTRDGRLPWTPLSTDEFLAFRERDLERRIAAFEVDKAEATASVGLDEAEVMEAYEVMKGIDPEAAEEYLANMKAFMAEAPAQMAAQLAQGDASLAGELAALRAYRASLSPEQLAAQARAGMGVPISEEERMSTDLLVKDDPGFGWDRTDPNRIQLVIVSRGDLYPEWDPILQHVVESFDYDALARLMR